jgi:4-azaleucine resistance transporter AzlC
MAGYVVLGTGFGILLRNAGYGVLWAAAMSLLIYAGSMQYVGVSLLTGGASVLTTLLTTFMVNARHLFYSISMVDTYKDAGRYKPYMIFALTDETYSLLCDGKAPEGADPNLYRFLVSLFNQSYWVAGSVIGSLLGGVLPFSTAGIEFSMTALFIASFTEQWLTTRDHIPALTGLLSTLVCLVIFGKDRFLIPAMLLITLVLTLLRRREEGETV